MFIFISTHSNVLHSGGVPRHGRFQNNLKYLIFPIHDSLEHDLRVSLLVVQCARLDYFHFSIYHYNNNSGIISHHLTPETNSELFHITSGQIWSNWSTHKQLSVYHCTTLLLTNASFVDILICFAVLFCLVEWLKYFWTMNNHKNHKALICKTL